MLGSGLASTELPATVGCPDDGVVGIYRDTDVLAGPLDCIADGVEASPAVPGEKEGTGILCPARPSLLFFGIDGLKTTEEVIGRSPEKPGVKGRADLLKIFVMLGEMVAPPPVMPDGDWS